MLQTQKTHVMQTAQMSTMRWSNLSESTQYLIRSGNMSCISSLVDGSVRDHSRNVLVLAVEVSCHHPSLRKPNLTRKVKHAIRMLHLAKLFEQYWLPLVNKHIIGKWWRDINSDASDRSLRIECRNYLLSELAGGPPTSKRHL